MNNAFETAHGKFEEIIGQAAYGSHVPRQQVQETYDAVVSAFHATPADQQGVLQGQMAEVLDTGERLGLAPQMR